MNRFRVRREVLILVTVLEPIDAPSSSDEKLVYEDVRERDNGGRFIVGRERVKSRVELYLYNQP